MSSKFSEKEIKARVKANAKINDQIAKLQRQLVFDPTERFLGCEVCDRGRLVSLSPAQHNASLGHRKRLIELARDEGRMDVRQYETLINVVEQQIASGENP